MNLSLELWRIILTALRALARNPMRALLTTLGIFIGVAAVIAVMQIGNGSSATIQSRVASMGANNLMVLPGAAASGGVSWGMSSVMTLTPADAEAIATCPSVKASAPVVRASGQLIYGNRNWVPHDIVGSTTAYLEVRDWKLEEGENFTDRDVRNSAKVCVVGKTLVRELFGGQSPVGKELRVQSVTFRVVGVLSPKGANMMGMDQDDILVAPWTTIRNRVSRGGSSASGSTGSSESSSSGVKKINQIYPNSSLVLYPTRSEVQQANTPQPVKFDTVNMITVAARSTGDIKPAIEQISQLLHERHRLRADEPDDFTVRDLTEMTNTMTSISGTITMLLVCVAFISLVVGGVGIMNIMLVSVTERTREIGLRMAVGAKSGNIMLQFLVEAMVLCLLGGLIGVAVGLLVSWIVQKATGWPIETSWLAIGLAFAISSFVGFIFGLYPAWKASRLDPIEALRYE